VRKLAVALLVLGSLATRASAEPIREIVVEDNTKTDDATVVLISQLETGGQCPVAPRCTSAPPTAATTMPGSERILRPYAASAPPKMTEAQRSGSLTLRVEELSVSSAIAVVCGARNMPMRS
jgi:hypothetical protein